MSVEPKGAAFQAIPVHRTEIDGVPVFWSDVPGPRTGSLMFGVGRAHEPATKGGISHLVEHLALAPLAQPEYAHNGFVSGSRTVFHATGTEDELTAFFDSVIRSIGDLPLSRLGMERRILRQESRTRGVGVPADLMWYRFGTRGYGLLSREELGLDWLGPDVVAEWARTHFCRENAAMWFSGPPPSRLRLPLGSGHGPEPIATDAYPGLALPSYLEWPESRVALSYLAEDSAAAFVTLDSAARRARHVVRFQRGLVYDIRVDLEWLEAGTVHCTIATDCPAEHVATVRDEILLALDTIARDGLNPDEVRRGVRWYRDNLAIQQAQLGILDSITFKYLRTGTHETVDSSILEFETIDGAAAGDELGLALESLLVCSRGDPPAGRSWSSYQAWSPGIVDGQRFLPPGRRVAGMRLPPRAPEPSLTVGSDGVTWRSAQGYPLTVRYADLVACRHWPGDIRELWGLDGYRVWVRPMDWHDGLEAVRLVDAAVRQELVVCEVHAVGAFRDPDDHPAAGGEHR
jgi:zinc protease